MMAKQDDFTVSVIIPCYNQALLIEETIHSVLASTYLPIEIIIVDDGSTDQTMQVVEALAKQYPIIKCYQQQNGGPSVARNHAISKASGSFILPLDGDDLISPDYIAQAIHTFKQDPTVKVVYCQAEKFGAKIGKWNLKPFSLENLAKDNMIFVSALYRKSDWEACGGYPEDLRWVSEDWVFWIAMLKNGGKVVQLSITGFYYRISPNSRRKGMDKQKKQRLIDYINTHHRDFVYRYLDGPLRFQRRQSKRYNRLLRFFGLLKD